MANEFGQKRQIFCIKMLAEIAFLFRDRDRPRPRSKASRVHSGSLLILLTFYLTL